MGRREDFIVMTGSEIAGALVLTVLAAGLVDPNLGPDWRLAYAAVNQWFLEFGDFTLEEISGGDLSAIQYINSDGDVVD